jgi:uncharacterized protein with NRDE domain
MCLILLALRQHPSHKLILAANRDEYYDRPSALPAFWKEAPGLLAGKDLRSGGTWLGITKKGRIAAITNYRDPASTKRNAPSRGWLVREFLLGSEEPVEYLAKVRQESERYNGFNLLVGVSDELYWYSNRAGDIVKLSPGFHGISNHLLDTPWPKVIRGRQGFSEILRKNKEIYPETLFELLRDGTPASEEMLPDTGVGTEWERILSPIFIVSSTYGTRSSTLIFIEKIDQVTFLDRTFNAPPNSISSEFAFTLES